MKQKAPRPGREFTVVTPITPQGAAPHRSRWWFVAAALGVPAVVAVFALAGRAAPGPRSSTERVVEVGEVRPGDLEVEAVAATPGAAPRVTLLLGVPGAVERFVAAFEPRARAGVRARLEDARMAGVTRIPLAVFLPDWAHARLDPTRREAESPVEAMWRTTHFADGVARAGDTRRVEAFDAHLRQEYTPVGEARWFGDVLVWRDRSGRVAHAANWLLGGFVFERADASSASPWRIARLGDASRDQPAGSTLETWRPSAHD